MDRRTALGLIGQRNSLVGGSSAGSGAPDLRNSNRLANLGTLFPYIDRLAARNQYPLLVPDQPLRAGSRNIARPAGIVLDALGYKPAPVPLAGRSPGPADMGGFVREKVPLLHDARFPGARLRAYSEGLKGRAPAIVDLHRTGGMFLFGQREGD